jgi:hypothetical protein
MNSSAKPTMPCRLSPTPWEQDDRIAVGFDGAYPNNPSAGSDDEELRRMVGDDPELRELARTMFPWKKF